MKIKQNKRTKMSFELNNETKYDLESIGTVNEFTENVKIIILYDCVR